MPGGAAQSSLPEEKGNQMSNVPDPPEASQGKLLYMGDRQGAAAFEAWLATGRIPDHGPAVMLILRRARATILALRQSTPGAPKGD